MDTILAVCGIDCANCDAYQATQANDMVALEQIAAKWRENFSPEITTESIICDGCLSKTGRMCSYCSECAVSTCAQQRGYENCGHCPDFIVGEVVCEKVAVMFTHGPENRARLEAVRASL